MAAYVISNLEIVDKETYAEFRQRFPGMVEAFGGKLLGRGDVVDVIGEETQPGYHRVIIMEFPTVEQARAWDQAPQNSPEYAELRALREKAGHAVLTIVSGD